MERYFRGSLPLAQNAPRKMILSRDRTEGGPILTLLNADKHRQDALDLARRARDYVALEVGRAPDAAYIDDFFNTTPPEVDRSNLHHFGIRKHARLTGMLAIAEGYEQPDDWWIGLLLIDPAFRSKRIGRNVVKDIRKRAHRRGINALKLSVLYANPRGLKFWLREGFVHHRDAPATPTSDGHDRVVLKYQL